MILKAVILTLALVAVSGDLLKVSDKQVATVVWDYLSDESTSAKEEAEQNSELTQRLKTLFQNHFWEQFRDKPYTYDVKDLVPFAIKLYQRLIKDSEKLKEENQKELEDLRAKMLPHAQEVSQKIADNLRLLREEIFEYPKMMYRDIDRQRWMVRVRTNTFTKRIETALRDHADELQALLASIAKELQAETGNDMVGNQIRPMTYVMELKERIDHHVGELGRSLAPFAQDVQEQLKHQLEGFSFLMKKNADQLVANVTAVGQEQWPRLKNLTEDAGEKLKGNSEDPQKVLAELGRLLDQQLEESQRMVGLYEEAFKNVTVQLMEEFGQKLGPDAGDDRDDYLIFLEKELKDKVKSFFNTIKERQSKLLDLENEDKNLTLREQAQNPAPSQESPAPSEQSPASSA